MSQQKKKDIADFFRPFAKTTPRKRRVADADGQDGENSHTSPSPSSARTTNIGCQPAVNSTAYLNTPSTPTAGRSISIPIRSPAATPQTVRRIVLPGSGTKKEPIDVETVEQPTSSLPLPSPSKRIVYENGVKVAVRDSDDSDDSLESLSDLIGRNKKSNAKASPSRTPKPRDDEADRRRLLSQFTAGRSELQSSRNKMREIQRREQANKLDLGYIFDDERKEAAARNSIQGLYANETGMQHVDRTIQPSRLNEQKLAAILTNDNPEDNNPGDLKRVLHAVHRTEALASEKTFTFFGTKAPIPPIKQELLPKFPLVDLVGSVWASADIASRNAAFLSGFMTELAATGKCDQEVFRWVIHSLQTERRIDLQEAYVRYLAASSSKLTRATISVNDIQVFFRRAGANDEVLQDASPIESKYLVRHMLPNHAYEHLLVILKMFSATCHDMDFASLSKLCSVISRLMLDHKAMGDNELSRMSNNVLETLVNLDDSTSRQHVHDRILTDLGSNMSEPKLQAQLLLNFIATSAAASRLRTYLARVFLLGLEDARELHSRQVAACYATGSSTLLTALSAYVSKSAAFAPRSAFTIGNSESYSTLNSLTIILDAAIAEGDPPANFADRHDENTFNADVDQLAKQIRDLYASIPDAGALHMSRTEAKNALLDVQHRLEWAVRTRQKRKRHVFDANGHFDEKSSHGKSKKKTRFSDIYADEEEMRKKNFMSRFLNRSGTAASNTETL